MALGWLTVLKTVPWTQVLSHAPDVADGARKLWSAVANKAPAPPANPTSTPTPTPSSSEARDSAPDEHALALSALERRVAAAEGTVAELQAQMRAGSELIKALADQNAELVKGIEALRTRAMWLTTGCIVAGVLAIAALVLFGWSAAAR